MKASSVASNGKAMTLAAYARSAWFGESSVLTGEPRQYDVVTLRDTELVLVNRATFLWLYENSASFSRFLVRLVNERVGQLVTTIKHDRIHCPTARIARSIWSFTDPGIRSTTPEALDISQEELALLAGVSRQTANRSLQALEAEGLLRRERERIVVVRPVAPARYDSVSE